MIEGKEMHPVDVYVGRRLRRRRRMLRMSQTDLADSIDVSFQQVQKYESAANRLSASKLYEISKALYTSPLWFYDGYQVQMAQRHYSLPGEEPVTDLEIDLLIQYFSRLKSAEERRCIIGILRTYTRTKHGLPVSVNRHLARAAVESPA